MTWAERVDAGLDRATAAAIARPGRTALLALLVLALLSGAALRVEVETDVVQLLRTPAAETLAEASRAFGLDTRAHLLVEAERGGREEDLLRFARELRARLAGDARFLAVLDGSPVDPEAAVRALAARWGPLYWPPAELPALEQRLSRAGMDQALAAQLGRLSLPGAGQVERWVELDPLELAGPLRRRVETLRGAWTLAPGQHHLSADGRALLVTVVAREETHALGGATRLVAALDEAAAEVLAQPWAAGLSLTPAGALHLAEESERVIAADLRRGALTGVLCSLVLLAGFLRVRPDRMLLLTLPILWGVSLGLLLFGALHPHMTILALGCLSAVLGMADDFTIHLVAATRALRAGGLGPDAAAAQAARELRLPMALGALSSASAFLAFLAADQPFLREMGLLSALGILSSLLGALWLLPPLIALLLRREPPDRGSAGLARDAGATRLAVWSADHPLAALLVAGLISAAAAALVLRDPPRLEDDLRRIHARDSRPLLGQERIARVLGGAREPVLLLLSAPDEAAALEACHRLEPELSRLIAEGALVARVSAAALLPPRAEQEAALRRVRALDGDALARELGAALAAAGFEPEAFQEYLAGLSSAATLPGPLDPAGLRALGLGALLDDLLHTGPEGARALVLVYPRQEPWSAASRQELRDQLDHALRAAGVEGRATGLHFVSAEAAAQVAGDFSRVSLLTGLAVLGVMLLRFRGLRLTALVLLPAGLGVLWTAGLFSLLGLRLNLMNLGVLPMVLALGVDDGIMIVHRALAGEELRGPGFRATAAGVVTTTATTVLGFGSLALSQNLGLASVGVLSAAGLSFCLLASLGVLPAALTLLGVAPRATDLPLPPLTPGA